MLSNTIKKLDKGISNHFDVVQESYRNTPILILKKKPFFFTIMTIKVKVLLIGWTLGYDFIKSKTVKCKC